MNTTETKRMTVASRKGPGNALMAILFALAFSLGVSGANAQINVYANASSSDWNSFLNVFDLNTNYLSGGSTTANNLPAAFGIGVLTLSPNTSAYNPPTSSSYIQDALFYLEDDVLSGNTVTFRGTCSANTLVAPYNSTAFVRSFASDYSSYVGTNVALMPGQPFNATLATATLPNAIGRHLQWGFETMGVAANPSTVGNLGQAIVTSTNTSAGGAVTVAINPAVYWNSQLNVDDLNSNWVSGGTVSASTLPATFNGSVLTLTPNTSAYNPPTSSSYIQDALYYEEDDNVSGCVVTFKGTCLTNTLVSPYNTTAFIRDFASDYSSYIVTNVALVSGRPFTATLVTAVAPGAGRHIQWGFETMGISANPATVASLGQVLVTTNSTSVSVTPPVITVKLSGEVASLTFPTVIGPTYTMQYKTNLTDVSWQTLSAVGGTGSTQVITNSANQPRRFYRLSIQ